MEFMKSNPWLHLIRHDTPRKYAIELRHILQALIACGYVTLDAQAKALGVNRSTSPACCRCIGLPRKKSPSLGQE